MGSGRVSMPVFYTRAMVLMGALFMAPIILPLVIFDWWRRRKWKRDGR